MAQTVTHPRLYLGVGLLWLGAALALGGSGRLADARPPAPQALLAAVTALLILAGAVLPGFRLWLAGLNLRQIVALHLTRFVGIHFLLLGGRGALPAAFAVPAGWGDVAVATGALALVLLVPDLLARRGWLLAWNLVGLADIIFVVATATRLALADPGSMQSLFRLPLSVVPVFLVPMIIGSHVLLFARLLPAQLKAGS
jgi:hypothetical protein